MGAGDGASASAELDELLARAIEDPSGIEEYVAAGPAVVAHLDRHLHERAPLRPLAIGGRARADAVTEVTDRVAAHHPQAAVACFSGRTGSGLAVVALGATGLPEALPAIRAALDDGSELVRLDAAMALGRLPVSAGVQAALRLALDDPEYLVRYHALRSAAVVGGPEELDRLDELAAHADHPEDELAREAIAAIRARM